MKTKKEIFWHLANTKNIYLPLYQLNLVMEILDNRGRKSFKSVLKEIENMDKLKKYTDKSKGAFGDLEKHQAYLLKVSRPIISIDIETGEELVEFSSIYQAAIAVGFPKGFGNICRAIKKEGTSYGLKWKYKNK